MREAWLALLLLGPALAGCVGGPGATPTATEDPSSSNGSPAANGSPTDLRPPEVTNGTLHVDVDVPVVTVGFPAEAEEGLADHLGNLTVDQWRLRGIPFLAPGDRARDPEATTLGTDRSADQPAAAPAPVAPRARYHVEPAGETVEARLVEQAVHANGTTRTGPAEAVLADALAAQGVDVDPNRPLLVLVDGSALEPPVETWRQTWAEGTTTNVSAFGGREPLVVADVDQLGLKPADSAALADLVHNATQFRLLQGEIFPTSTAPCHAVTLLTAVRPTTPSGTVPAREAYAPERLRRAFQNLTSDRVHVDSKVRELPADDPALDAVDRPSPHRSPGPTGIVAKWRPMLEYLAVNFDDYWVDHEGCQAYLSLYLQSEHPTTCTALSRGGGCVTGTAYYDEDTDHRIAVSRDYVPPGDEKAASRSGEEAPFAWVNELHLHETGHLFGLLHPSEYGTGPLLDPSVTTEGPRVFNEDARHRNATFADTWTVMRRGQFDGKALTFGAIDQANHQRAAAAETIVQAHQQGLAGTPAYERAMEHVADYEWGQASDELEPKLDTAR